MTIFVTGGAGFIGSNFIFYISDQSDLSVGAEGVHGLDKSDGADGNEILLLRRLGVVFLENMV